MVFEPQGSTVSLFPSPAEESTGVSTRERNGLWTLNTLLQDIGHCATSVAQTLREVEKRQNPIPGRSVRLILPSRDSSAEGGQQRRPPGSHRSIAKGREAKPYWPTLGACRLRSICSSRISSIFRRTGGELKKVRKIRMISVVRIPEFL
jgi:hypothetical protein